MINIATVDYSKLKKEYLRSDISQRDLAQKYDVSYGTLRKVAAKEQWTELRNKARTKADEKFIDAISDKEAQEAVDIVSVADKLLGKISKMLEEGVYNTQNIKNLTSALKDLKEIKGFKSEADIREQEARIAKLLKDTEGASETDTTVVIRFEEDTAKWSK